MARFFLPRLWLLVVTVLLLVLFLAADAVSRAGDLGPASSVSGDGTSGGGKYTMYETVCVYVCVCVRA